MKEATDKIKGLIDIQKLNGNYNSNEYMYGMLIGLECAYHTLLGEHLYTHTERPKEWLEDKIPKDFVPEVVSQEVLDQIDRSVQNFKNETLLPIPWELR